MFWLREVAIRIVIAWLLFCAAHEGRQMRDSLRRRASTQLSADIICLTDASFVIALYQLCLTSLRLCMLVF